MSASAKFERSTILSKAPGAPGQTDSVSATADQAEIGTLDMPALLMSDSSAAAWLEMSKATFRRRVKDGTSNVSVAPSRASSSTSNSPTRSATASSAPSPSATPGRSRSRR